MKILAIETSCDETGVSIAEVKGGKVKILSKVVSSQIKLHSKWGGVVPTLAAREHLKNLLPCLQLAIKKAGFNDKDIQKEIDVIGVTNGPGLIPALLMGVNFAKALSYSWRKPLVPVNHLEGHLYTPWVDSEELTLNNNIFPLLGLIVSGGHTMLVKVKDYLDYEVIGETLDDAAGEAFDKVARILGLGYPGGPLLSKLAQNGKPNFEFPVPLKGKPGLDFSFSGLKTAVLYKSIELTGKKVGKFSPKPDLNLPLTKKQTGDIAKAFEIAAIESLIMQTKKALKKEVYSACIIGGGVAANTLLRNRISREIKKDFPEMKIFLPPTDLTGDNAAMLVPAIYLKWKKGNKRKFKHNWKSLEADANLRLN